MSSFSSSRDFGQTGGSQEILQSKDELIGELRSKLKELKKDYALLDGFANAVDRANKLNEARVEDLKKKVNELELKLTTQKPLYDIGVSIRARFLQCLQGSKSLIFSPKQPRGKYLKFNKNLKTAGDAAAHNANGAIDRFLFEQDVLPVVDQNRLRPIFTGLYTYTPDNHAELPHKMQEIIDYDSTIRVLKVKNNNMRPLAERETAMIDIELVRRKYETLDREAFERNEDIARRVIRVKELTERIVRMDHFGEV